MALLAAYAFGGGFEWTAKTLIPPRESLYDTPGLQIWLLPLLSYLILLAILSPLWNAVPFGPPRVRGLRRRLSWAYKTPLGGILLALLLLAVWSVIRWQVGANEIETITSIARDEEGRIVSQESDIFDFTWLFHAAMLLAHGLVGIGLLWTATAAIDAQGSLFRSATVHSQDRHTVGIAAKGTKKGATPLAFSILYLPFVQLRPHHALVMPLAFAVLAWIAWVMFGWSVIVEEFPAGPLTPEVIVGFALLWLGLPFIAVAAWGAAGLLRDAGESL